VVDGQRVVDLECDLKTANSLDADPVAALSRQKKNLDACLPGGGAFNVKWIWTVGQPTAVEVMQASDASSSQCITQAVALMQGDGKNDGTCVATVLVSKLEVATAAANALPAPRRLHPDGVAIRISRQKSALDACVPAGAAFQVKWSWARKKATQVEVTASTASASACIRTALERTRQDDNDGDCQAILLVGEKRAAETAADALAARLKHKSR
jgi:hypothetical protein